MRTSVGRYRVTGVLGEGGMGVVYSAHDDRLDRTVAIKTLRTDTTDPSSRERLQREARAAARVNHPSICQLYELGEVDDEIFLAMELLQGESLAQRLSRGPLSPAEALPIALAVLAGLEALHRDGIIHRDLKPSNIFLTPHGAKLLDFGVASVAVPDRTMTRLTTPGVLLGTPLYCAPEQLRGDPVDARSDLFAAGDVFYEMLAGRPPFEGRTAMEVFHKILNEQPPPLAGDAAVAAFDRVVRRALAKSPADRPATAAAMAAELRDAMSVPEAGTGQKARTVTRLIVLPFRMLRPDAETDFLALSVPDAVTSALSGIESLVVRSSAAALRYGAETPDFRAIASDAQVDAVLIGTILRAGAQLRVATQLVAVPGATVLWSNTAQVPVGDLFQLQDDLTQRLVESLSLPLSAQERQQLRQDVPADPAAYELYLRARALGQNTGDWPSALKLYRECVAQDASYAPAWAGLARMHRLLGKYLVESDVEHFREAEAAVRRALELNPDLSYAENLYAHIEVDLGRAEEAMIRLLRRARDRRSDPLLFAGLTHASRYCGLLNASLSAYEHAVRLDPKVPTSVSHTHFMRGDYAKAFELSEETIPYTRNLCLVMMGRPEEALASLEQIDATLPSRMVQYTSALLHLIRGDRQRSVESILRQVDIPDPEGRYYVARHLVQVGEIDRALGMLAGVVEDGFFCLPALARDPWLDPVRSLPAFAESVRRAEARHRRATISFLSAEGDRVLGVPYPV
jgi:TolB-like protein/predicted Ser/Thr protein kinase/Tfp pilus assembly protein PilF